MIRKAKITDCEGIKHLSNHLGYETVSIEIAEKWLSEILESSSDRLWVFENQGNIVGWIHAFLANRVVSPSFVEISGLVVDSKCRRDRIGSILVNVAENWACALNLKLRARSNTARKETHMFYESMNFEIGKSQYVFEKVL